MAVEGVTKEASVGTRTTLEILDAQKELMAEKLEFQEKYENLLAEIEEEEDGKTSN